MALVRVAESIVHKKQCQTQLITATEVRKAISNLNNGKSPDIHGLMAEHVKYAPEATLQLLADILNIIIQKGKIPEILLQDTLYLFQKATRTQSKSTHIEA